jgi:hypothetical protein
MSSVKDGSMLLKQAQVEVQQEQQEQREGLQEDLEIVRRLWCAGRLEGAGYRREAL